MVLCDPLEGLKKNQSVLKKRQINGTNGCYSFTVFFFYFGILCVFYVSQLGNGQFPSYHPLPLLSSTVTTYRLRDAASSRAIAPSIV